MRALALNGIGASSRITLRCNSRDDKLPLSQEVRRDSQARQEPLPSTRNRDISKFT